ncbi:MAG TPA: ComEC/Rec2 family competence protein, partial [Chitinophagales bacterium]|nr:ComEC/Rec2 family competence protein [Chitinophagales bacterium]
MKTWNAAPLVRLLLPFITGISFAIQQPVYNRLILVAVYLFYLFVCIVTIKLTRLYQFSWLYGVILNGLLLITGYELTILKTDQYSGNHFFKFKEHSTYCHVRVLSCTEKEKTVKLTVEMIAVHFKQHSRTVSGKAILYVEKEFRSLQLHYGDELVVKNRFNDVPAPKNPNEFDYRRFLFYKNIYQQAYLTSVEWLDCGVNSGNNLIKFAIGLQERVLSVFQAAGLNKDEFSVASAILIGNRDKLDSTILASYAQTGVLHILSISGMHVALVFFVLNKALFFFDRLKHGRLPKACLLICFLWLYTILSGLSPSVLRAATMLSFVVLGESAKRNLNTYNTLAASAFLLLVINPYLLADVGFQLSYLAVIGIISIQSPLSNFFSTGIWLPDKLLALLSVSLAAQLATFPISLFYFHQFPNYFLLSNLVVMPLSTAIIYTGMLLIAVSSFPFVFQPVALLFSRMLCLLNDLINRISHFPYAVTQDISIQIPETVMLYVWMLLFYFFLRKKQVYLFKLFLCMGMVLA